MRSSPLSTEVISQKVFAVQTVNSRRRGVSLALAVALFVSGSWTSSAYAAPVLSGTLESVETDLTLRELEERSTEVAARAVEATVGLKIGRNLGSGVIVSADGYIITAGHVVDSPGQAVDITLAGGRVISGRTLGVNRWIDSGLIKIEGKGPWPFLEMGSGASLDAGDWVLALGHPGGVEEGRPPVVRLGRVTSSDARVIRSDCTIVSGDSGGPLVDLSGRVVGIHTSLRPVLVANDHLPVDTYRRTWDLLKSGKSWGGKPGGRAILGVKGEFQDGGVRLSSVVEGLAADLAGLMVGDVITALGETSLSGGFAELEQRISEHSVGDPVQLAVDRDSESLDFLVKLSRYEQGEPVRIVRTPWSALRRKKNDSVLMRTFQDSVRSVKDSVASIVCNGQRVALGSVLSEDGQILTKASELSGEVTCWIAGHSYAAELVGINREYDLALLQIDASGLDAIEFVDDEPEIGQWIVTPGTTSLPIAVGILSAGPRTIPIRSGFLGVSMQNAAEGVRIERVVQDSSAEKVGLLRGDFLVSVNGRSGLTQRSTARILGALRPNSEVELEYRRGAGTYRVRAVLGSRPEEENNPVEQQNRQAGPLSKLRSGFPTAFQHDTVLVPSECGGPLLDLSGRAIGVNLARAGRTSSYGLPGELVRKLVAKIERKAADHSATPDKVMR